MASRSISDLDARIQGGANAVLDAWKEKGFDVLVTCTYRSNEEQDALYAKGRTAPGPRVTNARAGESMHNHRLAIDFVPLVHGKPAWGEEKLFEILARIAQMADPRVKWGGDFVSINDKPHIEWRLPAAGPDGGVAGNTLPGTVEPKQT